MKMAMRLAWRSIKRNRGRTLIVSGTVALGLFCVLYLQSVMLGQADGLIKTVTTGYIGNIQVQTSEFFKNKTVTSTFDPTTLPFYKDLPPKFTSLSRVNFWGSVNVAGRSAVVRIEGQDVPQNLNLVSGDPIGGASDNACEKSRIWIGAKLAEVLGVSISDRVVLMGEGAGPDFATELFYVAGIFDSGSKETDRAVAYASLTCLQKLMGIQGVHEWVVKSETDEITLALKNKWLPLAPAHLKVTDWSEQLPRMKAVQKFNDTMLVLVQVLVFSLVGIAILNTLMIGILERIREFGILGSMGTPKSQIILWIVLESLIMILIGAVIGSALSLIWVKWASSTGIDVKAIVGEAMMGEYKVNTVIYPHTNMVFFVKALSITVTSSVFAVLIPVYRAVTIKPIKAILES